MKLLMWKWMDADGCVSEEGRDLEASPSAFSTRVAMVK